MAGGWNKGLSSALAKLSPSDVRKIRASELGIKTLARLFDVSRKTIQNVKHRRTYRWVSEEVDNE